MASCEVLEVLCRFAVSPYVLSAKFWFIEILAQYLLVEEIGGSAAAGGVRREAWPND